MPVKRYGIYIAYGPIKNFAAEGLGRHLGEFLKAAQDIENTKFVIAAPAWFREPLNELKDGYGLRDDAFEFIMPRKPPVLWVAYSTADRLKKRIDSWRRRKRETTRDSLRDRLRRWIKVRIRRFVGTRNPLGLLLVVPILVLLSPFAALAYVVWKAMRLLRRILPSRVKNVVHPKRAALRFADLAGSVAGRARGRLYRILQDAESRYISELANERNDIFAWYAPSAFWQNFNVINAPKLTCVPDIVLSEFPLAFSAEEEGGDARRAIFDEIVETVENGGHFATYSTQIRDITLGDKFGVPASKVRVIPHGANRLDRYVNVTGFPDNDKASWITAEQYFRGALSKCVNNATSARFASSHIAYIFYASQFRPNKNVLTLLKAFEFLRKRKGLPLKLVLTGDPRYNAVHEFLSDNKLNDDVLCLRGLSEKELAGCYKLARLAVNPSLAEGGMPFTLTEALSVGTPVIMGDIPVTREIITSNELRDAILFNPYDWRALADKIEWALENRTELLDLELRFYNEQLVHRSWSVVVREYVDALESIAATAPTPTAGKQTLK